MKGIEMGEVVRLQQTQGQHLFTAIYDELQNQGATLPRTAIAIAAKHGTEALTDGVPSDVVLAGCIEALKCGKGRFAHDYIAEMAVVKAGLHTSPKQHQQKIEAYKNDNDPSVAAQRDLLNRALKP
jgi:hypothetical protein